MTNLFKVLTRKKVLDAVSVTETQLARVLNTFDLTALGVGSTLGVGVYVLAGHVSRDTAGPAVVLSFLIAGLASVFAGLCYAEFGSRVPRAGSAYIYSYVTIGEFVAFIIGWNLLLEYVIGSASVARGLSLYFDTLINNTMQDTFREIAPINIKYMSPYFDFFSFGVSILLSIALAIGMKESSRLNNVFTFLNIGVVLFVVIAGSIKANPKNWSLPSPPDGEHGSGGFFPYGISGVIKGAATCFYGFVGFDCIATTGEEVKNPQRAIPLSIVASLLVIFLAYFSTATVTTLMVPYFLQDVNAPIPYAFSYVGLDWARWVVSIGGIFGLCASLFGAMFPLPRIIYAMASDGIIFKFLGKVHPRFHTPVIGTLLAGLLTGMMSSLFELKQLVAMMSIGTLLAYTIVAACVLLLRYREDKSPENLVNSESLSDSETDEEVTFVNVLKQTYNFKKLQEPTKITQTVVTIQICIYALLSLAFGLCMMFLQNDLRHAHIWAIVLVAAIALFMLLVLLSIVMQPTSKVEVRFKVPWVPLIPALSILVNIYLMLMLDINTWIRFGVWMTIGLPMYFICIRCAASSHNYPKSHAIANGNVNTVNKSNGHLNASFVYDDDNKTLQENEKIQQSEDFIQNALISRPFVVSHVAGDSPRVSLNSVGVDDALAALDEILSKEDDSNSFAYEKPSNRLSVDTVSIVSNAHLEESVVALVHQEDVLGSEERSENAKQQSIEKEGEQTVANVVQQIDNTEMKHTDEKESEQTVANAVQQINETGMEQIDETGVQQTDEKESEQTVANAIQQVDETGVQQTDENESEQTVANAVQQIDETGMEQIDENKVQQPESNREKQTDEDGVQVTIENVAEQPAESENQQAVEDQSNVVNIPPPPPMKDFERLISEAAVSSTLRNVEENNLLRSKSESNIAQLAKDGFYFPPRKESIVDLDDNVEFGSKAHTKVISKLNKLFEKQTLGFPSRNVLSKPEVTRVSDEGLKDRVSILPGMKHVVPAPSENDHADADESNNEIVEEVMKPSDIKKKLNEILRSDPRLTLKLITSNNVSDVIDEADVNKEKPNGEIAIVSQNEMIAPSSVVKSKSDDTKAKMQHKQLMNNTLNSIKLRKVDKPNGEIAIVSQNEMIAPSSVVKSKSDDTKAKMQHKQLMNNTLNSIKLRKVDMD